MRKKPSLVASLMRFVRSNWVGTAIILLATVIYFAPLLPRLNNYSGGGDSLFNAWTLARNHNCLTGGCESYLDGNIFFPNEDSMLYSETQLSTGLLTLPLHFINDNPIFSYNVWKIISTFLAGWFMYLLAKRLSKGHEGVSILAGLIFAFAPFKMSALGHLQNLSIFYLPLAVLLILSYLDKPKRRYLAGLFVTLALLFYASWYQMVFALAGLGVMLLSIGIFKLASWKKLAPVGAIIGLAALTTLPLAKEYIRFSNQNNAGFTIGAQTSYASSVVDYVIPEQGTALGKIYNAIAPDAARRKPYNLDSQSYHGVVLYLLIVTLMIVAFKRRKKSKNDRDFYKWGWVWSSVGVLGVLFSLGPLLKVSGKYIYATLDNGIGLSVPLPYLFLDIAFPPIQFIRAVGRWSVLFLFVLCIAVAFLPHVVKNIQKLKTHRRVAYGIFIALCIIELAPLHFHYMSYEPYQHNLEIPAVYGYVKTSKEINNLLILRADSDYPQANLIFARVEDVMWAGYHNKNIFNGYSGYTPPDYEETYRDFQDLQANDLAKMKSLGLRYILVDKLLSASNPKLQDTAKHISSEITYEDERYVLLKI